MVTYTQWYILSLMENHRYVKALYFSVHTDLSSACCGRSGQRETGIFQAAFDTELEASSLDFLM